MLLVLSPAGGETFQRCGEPEVGAAATSTANTERLHFIILSRRFSPDRGCGRGNWLGEVTTAKAVLVCSFLFPSLQHQTKASAPPPTSIRGVQHFEQDKRVPNREGNIQFIFKDNLTKVISICHHSSPTPLLDLLPSLMFLLSSCHQACSSLPFHREKSLDFCSLVDLFSSHFS